MTGASPRPLAHVVLQARLTYTSTALSPLLTFKNSPTRIFHMYRTMPEYCSAHISRVGLSSK